MNFKIRQETEIEDVLRELSKVKKTAKGWVACCPAHDDENPSLSVSEGDDGKLLMYCHRGCSFENIVHALGLNEREQHEHRERSKTLNIVKTYDYVDERRNLLYQVCRLEPKDFRLRSPNGRGGWNWNLGESRRVLFNLPDVVEAKESNSCLVFVEGEKDALNVKEKLGMFATTIATGANGWRDEYAEDLRGIGVVILPDNDGPGMKFAEEVATSIYGKAESVKVVSLPNLPEKGDVSDWLDQGGNSDALMQLIEATDTWRPPVSEAGTSTNATDFFIAKSSNDWIHEALAQPVPKMLFGEFWFEGEICVLFADSNVGKSALAVQIADSVSKGISIGHLSCEVAAEPVLYFDFELSSRQFASRYSQNVNGFTMNEYQFSDNFIRVALNPDATLSDDDDFEDELFHNLEQLIRGKDAKIVIIDNITYLRNDNEQAKNALRLMKRLKFLKERHGLSVLVLAHTPKRDLTRELTQNDLAGSKQLINFCDSSFAIGKSQQDESIRYLKQIKERNTHKVYGTDNVCIAELVKEGNCLRFQFNGFDEESEHLFVKHRNENNDDVIKILEMHDAGKTQREISKELNVALGKVNRLLRRGLEERMNSFDSEVKGIDGVHVVHCSQEVNSVNALANDAMPLFNASA